MFCILSLMPQKLNALITSDLLWSALLTVPRHILFDLYAFNKHMHASRGQPNVVMIAVSFQLVDIAIHTISPVIYIYIYIATRSTFLPRVYKVRCPCSARLAGPLLDPHWLCLLGYYIFTTQSALSKRSCSNPCKSRLH